MHLVMRGHFQSRDKDGDHTIQSAIAETICCMQTSCLYVIQKRIYCRSKFYTVGISMVFAPVTLTWWASHMKMTCISWTGCAQMNFP